VELVGLNTLQAEHRRGEGEGMANLLEETKTAILDSGHDVADVVFIGSRESGHECSWLEFEKMADRTYDSGFGAAEVCNDLEIVFEDGSTMTREEYDGSEWWQYSAPFNRPNESKPLRTVFATDGGGVGWRKLAEVNAD